MPAPSTEALVTPLRRHMLHDMMMRGLLSRTQDQYIRHVRRFAAYLGRPPDMAMPEDVRNFRSTRSSCLDRGAGGRAGAEGR